MKQTSVFLEGIGPAFFHMLKQTLYHVAFKAGLYYNAVCFIHVPMPCDNANAQVYVCVLLGHIQILKI